MIGDTLFFSPMGLTKGLLSSPLGLYSFGVEPDVYLNFAAGYSKAGGVINPVANSLTCVRTSTRYIDDVSGNWTLVGVNLSGVSSKGLLVEEARTNSLRNNSMQGAVVGSPGTLPTNWTVITASGLATNVIATGTTLGLDYIDLQITGTSAGTSYVLGFDGTAQAASSTQVWSQSLFTAIQAGTAANITAFNIEQRFIGASNIDTPFTPTATLARYGATATAGVGTTNIQPAMALTIANATSINITLRIGWPQLELGAWATSPIRTISAAVQRTMDLVKLASLPTFGSAMSLYVAGTPLAPISFASVQNPMSASDGTVNNRCDLQRNGASGQARALWNAGGGAAIGGGAVWSQSAFGKAAMAGQAADQAGSFNGGAIFTSAGTGVPPISQVNLGTGSTSVNPWNGYITEAAIWASARLTNAQLQAGTT